MKLVVLLILVLLGFGSIHKDYAAHYSGPQCSSCLMDCIYGGIIPPAEASASMTATELCHKYCATVGCDGRACPDCTF